MDFSVRKWEHSTLATGSTIAITIQEMVHAVVHAIPLVEQISSMTEPMLSALSASRSAIFPHPINTPSWSFDKF